MDVLGTLAVAVGAATVLLGLYDAFLTILHPDRDGRLTAVLNRAVWWVATTLARARPKRQQAILGFAGPSMVVGNILVWMVLPILGYGLMVWPFLTGGFETPVRMDRDLTDALYFSGVTFTTLGFGDITPVGFAMETLAVAEAITGFLVMSTSIAYIVAVFEGVDQRDALALQIYAETGGTWNAGTFIDRALLEEDAEALRHRLDTWAALVRELHGRLYRFHGLALYLRTHGLDLGPERMMYAFADVTLRANVMASSPQMRRLRPAAEHLALSFEHFMRAVVRRHGSAASRQAVELPEPTDEDRRIVREAWSMASARYALPAPDADPASDERLLRLTARLRVFLAELDGLTRWRTLHPGHEGPP